MSHAFGKFLIDELLSEITQNGGLAVISLIKN
jgi:hypothetical protein